MPKKASVVNVSYEDIKHDRGKFYNDPINISIERWKQIIEDKDIISEKVLEILLFLLNCDNFEASGGEIAKKLNYSHHAPLNKIIPDFSKRILEKYKDIIPPQRSNGDIRYWHIPFLGYETKEKFPWILRYELKEALKNTYSEQVINEKSPEEFIEEIVTYREGKQTQVLTTVYERNPKARAACLNHYGYICQICNFDFEKVYGAIGKGIIHVHHTNKASYVKEEHEIDPINELVPVCPNCHTVIHSKKDMFTIDEMKEIIVKAKEPPNAN